MQTAKTKPENRTLSYDAILLFSFGGPNRNEDVVAFLRNVTRGRGIPEERLVEVGEHYFARDGKSPINDLNRKLLAELREGLATREIDVPVYWGNRNWAPYVIDVLREIATDGHRSVLVLTTSAYSAFSGCCQYNGDLMGALDVLEQGGIELEIDRVRKYFNIPAMARANKAAILAAFAQLEAGAGTGVAEEARLLFVTHSIPLTMNEGTGPEPRAYELEHIDMATYLAGEVSRQLGRTVAWDLTYCSRSGPPSQPWLEPDVGDRIAELAATGQRGVVLAPIGFISDHMEVVYDLDTEAKETADEQGVAFARAATAGDDRGFVEGLVDLLVERSDLKDAETAAGTAPEQPTVGARGAYPPCWPVARCCGSDISPIAPRGTSAARA